MKVLNKVTTIFTLILLLIVIGLFVGTYIDNKLKSKNEVKNYKTLQGYFPKVYTLKKAETYLAIDKQGSIHLIYYHPYSDEVIIEYGEITEAITTKDVINVIR